MASIGESVEYLLSDHFLTKSVGEAPVGARDLKGFQILILVNFLTNTTLYGYCTLNSMTMYVRHTWRPSWFCMLFSVPISVKKNPPQLSPSSIVITGSNELMSPHSTWCKSTLFSKYTPSLSRSSLSSSSLSLSLPSVPYLISHFLFKS